jgi:hypothetical protein
LHRLAKSGKQCFEGAQLHSLRKSKLAEKPISCMRA